MYKMNKCIKMIVGNFFVSKANCCIKILCSVKNDQHDIYCFVLVLVLYCSVILAAYMVVSLVLKGLPRLRIETTDTWNVVVCYFACVAFLCNLCVNVLMKVRHFRTFDTVHYSITREGK